MAQFQPIRRAGPSSGWTTPHSRAMQGPGQAKMWRGSNAKISPLSRDSHVLEGRGLLLSHLGWMAGVRGGGPRPGWALPMLSLHLPTSARSSICLRSTVFETASQAQLTGAL